MDAKKLFILIAAVFLTVAVFALSRTKADHPILRIAFLGNSNLWGMNLTTFKVESLAQGEMRVSFYLQLAEDTNWVSDWHRSGIVLLKDLKFSPTRTVHFSGADPKIYCIPVQTNGNIWRLAGLCEVPPKGFARCRASLASLLRASRWRGTSGIIDPTQSKLTFGPEMRGTNLASLAQ